MEKYDLHDCSIVFCGDVGLGFKPVNKWFQWIHGLKLPSLLKKRKVDLYFIRGNHDNPAWFDDKTLVTQYLKAVSDYSVLSSANHNILCVGGGVSIDRSERELQMNFAISQYCKFHPSATLVEAREHITQLYWPDEIPVYNEPVIDSLTCQIDTVCSHVAPNEFVPLPGPFAREWFRVDVGLINDCAIERQTMSNVLTRLLENQHPLTKWYYGHYHFYQTNTVGSVETNLLDMARDGSLSLKELVT